MGKTKSKYLKKIFYQLILMINFVPRRGRINCSLMIMENGVGLEPNLL